MSSMADQYTSTLQYEGSNLILRALVEDQDGVRPVSFPPRGIMVTDDGLDYALS